MSARTGLRKEGSAGRYLKEKNQKKGFVLAIGQMRDDKGLKKAGRAAGFS